MVKNIKHFKRDFAHWLKHTLLWLDGYTVALVVFLPSL